MSNAVAYLTVALIVALNMVVVYGASLFGINGNGSPGSMNFVLGIGTLWVVGFAIRAVQLIARGDKEGGVGVAAKTLPYALLLVVLTPFALFLLEGARSLLARVG
jgi:hypothetical protein